MLEKFMVWSNDKIKTLQTEPEAKQFALKHQLVDYVIVRISEIKGEDMVLGLSVKDENDNGEMEWKPEADLYFTEDKKWFWDTGANDFSPLFNKAQEAVKHFVRTMRTPAEEEGSPRYSIWDVYTPAELGIKIDY